MMMSDPSSTDNELRRLIPRQYVGWQGKYVIGGDLEQHWRECRFVDISSAGAGLELSGSTVAELEGQRIVVAIQLKGEIRHSREIEHGRIGVGIEFVELTEAEKAYLTSLERLNARW